MAPLEYSIIGGGIAGVSLALALHHRGLNVHIYERAGAFGEIGAGVGFTPNAVKAMRVCHPGLYEAFTAVATRNVWPEKDKVFFDYYNGTLPADDPRQRAGGAEGGFSASNSLGQAGVHRAHFLDGLVRLLPEGIASFRKNLTNVTENPETGRLTMHFADGTTTDTDAVLACDGIKSRARALMYPGQPCAQPTDTHKRAYRGLVPMDKAIAAVGRERAENACMYLGPNGHVLTFAVAHGTVLNIVAFHQSDDVWADTERLTKPGTREHALKLFRDDGFGPEVLGLLALCEEELSIWAIFDLGHPVPSFISPLVPRTALVGDAAHATSPHHGAGAGMCIEDAAVLATLLADPNAQSASGIAAALRVYDRVRRERGQMLVTYSRRLGNMYDWRYEGTGRDMEKIRVLLEEQNERVYEVDVEGLCDEAVRELAGEVGV